MHVVGQLSVPFCDPICRLHHNLFVSAAVPVLQLFVEQHDVTIVEPPIFVVSGIQTVEHEYVLLVIPKTVVVAVFLFLVYNFDEFMVELSILSLKFSFKFSTKKCNLKFKTFCGNLLEPNSILNGRPFYKIKNNKSL
jgi:hypothetical protein